MAFIKTALSLMGWAFLCLAILNVPAFYHIIFRFLMVLIPGFLLGYNIDLFPNSLDLNVVTWCGIMAVLILPVTFLPRVKFSGSFLCSFWSIYLIMKIIVNKIIPLLWKTFQPTVWTTVIVWAVSILASLIGLVFAKDHMTVKELKRKWVITLDRAVAAFFVAATLLFPMLFFKDDYLRYVLVCIPLAVVPYFLDLLLYDKFLEFTFYVAPTEEEMEAMARRDERRARRRNSLPAKAIRGVGWLGLSTLHVGGSILTGVVNLMGAHMQNPIPSPGRFVDSYEQMERDYHDWIRPRQEQEEYEQYLKDTESAIKFYEENYQ